MIFCFCAKATPNTYLYQNLSRDIFANKCMLGWVMHNPKLMVYMLFFVAANANLKFAFEKYDPGFEWRSLYKKFQPANAVNSSELFFTLPVV